MEWWPCAIYMTFNHWVELGSKKQDMQWKGVKMSCWLSCRMWNSALFKRSRTYSCFALNQVMVSPNSFFEER